MTNRDAMSEIKAPVTGSVWKILVNPGAHVGEDDEIMILESMKMEIPVEAETSGVISELLVQEGDSVAENDPVAVLEED